MLRGPFFEVVLGCHFFPAFCPMGRAARLLKAMSRHALSPADNYAANEAEGDQQRQPGNPRHILALPRRHLLFAFSP
jgi:hypothetical protein